MSPAARPAPARATIPLQRGVVYGPVLSRRLGRSLGLNLLPDEIKVCSLDCRYCQYGWTGLLATNPAQFSRFLPPREAVARELEAVLSELAAAGTPPDTLTFSGNGEATLHPDFPGIVEDALPLRDRHAPACRTAILSNATQVHRPDVRAALLRLDDPILKLDAGTQEAFLRLNGPAPGVTFAGVLEGLRALSGRILLQALFVTGSEDNTTDDAVRAWVEAVVSIRPRAVQIYTLDRGPADRALRPAPQARLREIARLLAEAGVRAEVFA